MKNYTFYLFLSSYSRKIRFSNFAYRTDNNTGQIIRSVLFLISCLLVLFSPGPASGQTVDSPCECFSYTIVGRTDETYSIGDIGFSLTSASCYLVKGNLVVDQSTYWSGLRLKMEEKSQILVESHLSIYNSFLSGCGDMWKGIETTDSEADLFIHNSTIQAAEFAVKLGSQPGFVSFYNRFIDNYVGIVIGGDPFEPDEFENQIHRCLIWGCEFFTNTSLPDPYPGQYYYPSWPSTPTEIPYNQGFAAIYMSGTTGANIGYAYAEGADRNKIYQMRNGIILRNSVSDISGTDFYDFEGLIPPTVEEPILDLNQNSINMYRAFSRIEDNTMDNLMVGIAGNESTNTIFKNNLEISTPSPGYGFTRGITISNPQIITIDNNTITDGYRGIMVENVTTDFLIKSNILDRTLPVVTNYAIGILVRNAKLDDAEGVINGNQLVLGDALVHTGIHLISVNHIKVQGNTTSFVDGGGHQTRGILLVSAGNSDVRHNSMYAEAEFISPGNAGLETFMSAGNLVFCNSIESFFMDFLIKGPNNMSDIVSNQLKVSDYALFVQTPSMIGTQSHTGNTWPDNPYNDFGAFMSGSDPLTSAFFSRFLVDELEDSDFMPDPIGPTAVDNGDWFRDESTLAGTKTCLINITIPLIDPDTLQKLARTTLDFEDYNDQMSWFMKADIFEAMLNYPSLHSNTVLDSLYDAEENTALGQLVTLQNLLSSRFGVQKSQKNSCQDTMYYLSSDVVYIDSILALSPNDSATWLALRDLKVDSLSDKLDQWVTFLDDEYTESMNTYSEIENDLSILTTTNDLEDYLQQALLFKAQYLLGAGFSDTDSSDLVELAELCPWLGGRAISVAQEVYCTLDNNMRIPSADNCPSPSPFVIYRPYHTDVSESLLSIYPNPASESVTVTSPEVMNDVFLTDLNLRQIDSFHPNAEKFTFSVNKLTPANYLICIRTKQGTSIRQLTVTEPK